MPSPQRTLVAHQPAYLPWGGYFSRLLDAEELVLLDHVQFVPRSPQCRNLVRAPRGGPLRLSVPVVQRFGQRIEHVRIADDPWAARHWRSLQASYRRAPYWNSYAERLHHIYHRRWERLAELDITVTRLITDALGLDIGFVRSSALAPAGTRTEMLIDLARIRGADRIRVGPSGPGYLDRELLADAGIDVEVAHFDPPAYDQRPGAFTPGLSALDLIMWAGPKAKDILADAGSIAPLKAVLGA